MVAYIVNGFHMFLPEPIKKQNSGASVTLFKAKNLLSWLKILTSLGFRKKCFVKQNMLVKKLLKNQRGED